MITIRDVLVRRSPSFRLRIHTLTITPGKILCIAGPNGSGKTTLIDCLAGLLPPDAGSITLGKQPLTAGLQATKALVGLVPDDEQWLIGELCAIEYFELLQRVYREAGSTGDMAATTTELISRLHFTALRQPLQSLSHGNKKKVQLIAGLMHQPRVLIVDELRNGLDPLACIAAEQLLREAAGTGCCIIASTHDLWWAQRLADELLLLIDGTVAVYGRTKTLLKHHQSLEALFLQVAKAQP